MSATNSQGTKPLNCPKGYGLCWTCETWCDGGTASTPLPEPSTDWRNDPKAINGHWNEGEGDD